MNGADVEFEAGDGNGHQNESDGNRHTFGSGVEEAFAECEKKTHDEAEHEGENNFKKRFENDGKDIGGACADGFCNTERDRKYDKTDRVVERYDRKQDIGNGTLCLVLLNDHEGCGGSGRGRNSAENECRGKGKLIGHCEMERDEYAVYQKTSEDCLENTDYGSLFTDFFKRCKSKFVTDGKRDKAECNIGNDAKAFKLFMRDTDTGDSECAKEKRTDEDACNEICSNCGELNFLRKSGQEKTCKQSDGKRQKNTCCLRHD